MGDIEKRQRLKNLELDEVACVDKPANRGAKVALLKREGAPAEHSVTLAGRVAKLDSDKQICFGWFSIVEVDGQLQEDLQEDVLSPQDLETSAYNFVLYQRTATEMHQKNSAGEPIGVGRLCESLVLTTEKQAAIVESLRAQNIQAEMDLKIQGWWGGLKIDSAETWQKLRGGELRAFSVGGRGEREKTITSKFAKENEMETVITKAQAEQSLDSLVEKRRQSGESADAAMARLMISGDREFAEAYQRYTDAAPTPLSELMKAHKQGKKSAADEDDEEDNKDMRNLEDTAKSIAKRDGCTVEQGFLKAMKENPAAYERMESRAIAKGRRGPVD